MASALTVLGLAGCEPAPVEGIAIEGAEADVPAVESEPEVVECFDCWSEVPEIPEDLRVDLIAVSLAGMIGEGCPELYSGNEKAAGTVYDRYHRLADAQGVRIEAPEQMFVAIGPDRFEREFGAFVARVGGDPDEPGFGCRAGQQAMADGSAVAKFLIVK